MQKINILIMLHPYVKNNINGISIRFEKFAKYIDNEKFNFYIEYENEQEIYVKYKSIDIIHATNLTDLTTVNKVKNHYNTKLIISMENTLDMSRRFISQILSCDCVTFPSDILFNYFIGINKNSYVLKNGVDIIETFEHRDLIGKHKGLFIGTFSARKNIKTIFETTFDKDTEIYLIGPNPHNLVNKNPNVHYLGIIPHDEIPSYIHACDFVLVPSIYETFGIVGIEAMAYEAILLSSFGHGSDDYLTHEIAIDCGTTSQSIYNAVLKYKELNDKQKSIIKEKAKKIALKYSWKQITQSLENIYTEII